MCRALVLTGTPPEVAKAKRLASRFYSQIQVLSAKALGDCAIALFMPAASTARQIEMRRAAFEAALQQAHLCIRIYEIPAENTTAVPDPIFASEAVAASQPANPVVNVPAPVPAVKTVAEPVRSVAPAFAEIDFNADVPDIEVFAEEHFERAKRRF